MTETERMKGACTRQAHQLIARDETIDRLKAVNAELLEALKELCKGLAPTDAHVAKIGARLGPSLQGKLIHARRLIAKVSA